jgi:uncharacterized membrane protein YdbT with pleckstrin-like domain
MSDALFAVGYLIVIIGVAYMAHLMHIPQAWIIAIVIVLVGLGLIKTVQSKRGGA